MEPARLLPGCEAWSHRAGSRTGVLVVHGFTGAPFGMRAIAEAVAAAGHDVELPRLPGHGTSIDDMLPTRWSDWVGEVAAALAALTARVEGVVLIGQSMGGSLAIHAALTAPRTDAVVCINPLTRPLGAEALEMIDDLLDDGIAVAPGEGSDVADPAAIEVAYPGTPLAPLRSLMCDGVASITDRYHELTIPLRLFTSRQDHVVPVADSEHLAGTWGGRVEHTWLERSYHVASVDYDRDLIIAETLTFLAGLTAGVV